MTEAIATKDSVEAAAALIESEGGKVTLDAVIERIGGGSRTTVARLVRTWRSQRGEGGSRTATAPAFLMELAEPMLSRLADSARLEARREHERVERILAGQIEALGEELEHEAAEVERLTGELSAATEQVQVLAETVEALKATLREEEAARFEGIRQLAAEKSAHLETRARLEKTGAEFPAEMLERMRALEERIAVSLKGYTQHSDEGSE